MEEEQPRWQNKSGYNQISRKEYQNSRVDFGRYDHGKRNENQKRMYPFLDSRSPSPSRRRISSHNERDYPSTRWARDNYPRKQTQSGENLDFNYKRRYDDTYSPKSSEGEYASRGKDHNLARPHSSPSTSQNTQVFVTKTGQKIELPSSNRYIRWRPSNFVSFKHSNREKYRKWSSSNAEALKDQLSKEELGLGIHKQLFFGEDYIKPCTAESKDQLFCYKIMVDPPEIQFERPTSIYLETEKFTFDGFFIVAHKNLEIPKMNFKRGDVQHSVSLVEETVPSDFDAEKLNFFHNILFDQILKVIDWLPFSCKKLPKDEQEEGQIMMEGDYETLLGCRMFHFYPRFVNSENQCLDLDTILRYLTSENTRENVLSTLLSAYDLSNSEDQSTAKNYIKDSIVMCQYTNQCYRIDTVAFHMSPFSELANGGSGNSTIADELIKKNFYISVLEQPLLLHKPARLPQNREVKRVENPEDGKSMYYIKIVPQFCYFTGLKSDICQFALLLPNLCYHIRLFTSLALLEDIINVRFNDKELLKKALTHPSYSDIFATNANQTRKSYQRFGFHRKSSSKKTSKQSSQLTSFDKFIEKMSATPKEPAFIESIGELISHATHNQRLEFLGDAVLQFVCTSQLFLQFRNFKQGELTISRTALVNNKILAKFSQDLKLNEFVLYARTEDLMEGEGNQHLLADAFEALFGAIYIDQGLSSCREFFGRCLFGDNIKLYELWMKPKLHQFEDHPIDSTLTESPVFEKFNEFQKSTGIKFTSPHLLIQSFSHCSISNGLDTLDIGNNQRLEFLGDAVLQFVVSRYLFIRFPNHQEGQLTLLRAAVVNNRTLSDIAIELGFDSYLRYVPAKSDYSNENQIQRAMLAGTFEAFLAALFLDKNIEFVEAFGKVALFPRATEVVENKSWLHSKTKLRELIMSTTQNKMYRPIFRVISATGPPNMKLYCVGVFILDKKIAEGKGYSKTTAESNAALEALQALGLG